MKIPSCPSPEERGELNVRLAGGVHMKTPSPEETRGEGVEGKRRSGCYFPNSIREDFSPLDSALSVILPSPVRRMMTEHRPLNAGRRVE